MRPLGGVKFLHGNLWQKRVQLILRDFYFSDFFLSYAGALVLLLPTTSVNVTKSQRQNVKRIYIFCLETKRG